MQAKLLRKVSKFRFSLQVAYHHQSMNSRCLCRMFYLLYKFKDGSVSKLCYVVTVRSATDKII